MSECDWPPLDNLNWRPLFDAIEFLCQHFHWVSTVEAKLKPALDSNDLLSIQVMADGGRKPLTCWKEIVFELFYSKDRPGKLLYARIERVEGDLESFDLASILVWWPGVLKLCGLTVAQPEPAAQLESVPQSEPVPASVTPDQKPRRVDWGDWWKHEKERREQDLLPNKQDYLRLAEPLIKDRYGVKTVSDSELRRIKAALYRGDSERPKRARR